MHTLCRNKSVVYYAVYNGKSDVINDAGEMTGEKQQTYGATTKLLAYISPRNRSTRNEPYGVEHLYERTIITDDMSCPITEESLIWIDANITSPHDYLVKSVSKSINHITIIVKAVCINQ